MAGLPQVWIGLIDFGSNGFLAPNSFIIDHWRWKTPHTIEIYIYDIQTTTCLFDQFLHRMCFFCSGLAPDFQPFRRRGMLHQLRRSLCPCHLGKYRHLFLGDFPWLSLYPMNPYWFIQIYINFKCLWSLDEKCMAFCFVFLVPKIFLIGRQAPPASAPRAPAPIAPVGRLQAIDRVEHIEVIEVILKQWIWPLPPQKKELRWNLKIGGFVDVFLFPSSFFQVPC